MDNVERYSIEWRKKLADEYLIERQHVINMSKKEIQVLELGIAAGLNKAKRDIYKHLEEEKEKTDKS